MKKLFTITAICIAGQIFCQAIRTKESNEKFSVGNQNAIVTTIYENNANDVISEWKKVLKDFKNEKVKDSDNEVFGDNIVIKEWGNNPVDFYTKFEDDKKAKTVKMSVAVDLGGTYLASSPEKEKYNFVDKMVKEFAIKMTKEPIAALLKANEKQLDKFLDDQKDLEKEKKNLDEDIADYKKKITKAEKEIIDKDADIDKKADEVKVQKKVVHASSDAVSEQAKSSKKILDKLEDQLHDLEKDKKNLNNDIEDYKKKIEKTEKKITENEENQTKKKVEIDTQKKLVEETKKKLNAVN